MTDPLALSASDKGHSSSSDLVFKKHCISFMEKPELFSDKLSVKGPREMGSHCVFSLPTMNIRIFKGRERNADEVSEIKGNTF
ncbi:hypothetical protein SDJN02_14141 [Cucurbita argyrosperma subsp. argyrosperma]|nr:hypothetical protein SDJN02_14141 [Cucurbita argyrosperma subsp. argyrosperma]